MAQRNLSPDSAWSRLQRDTEGGTEARADEFATTQHTNLASGKSANYGERVIGGSVLWRITEVKADGPCTRRQ